MYDVRVTRSKRILLIGSFVMLLATGSACQNSEDTQNVALDTDQDDRRNRIQSAPTTPTLPSTAQTTTALPTTSAPTPSTIPEGHYIADGFAVQPPQGWKLIDQQSLDDGSAVEGVPSEAAEVIVPEINKVFNNGTLVAFYQFNDPNQYIPNVTISRLDPQPEANASEQATNTAADLQNQGFLDVSTSVSTSSTGTIVGVRYIVPAARTGFASDVFASSYVVFGKQATWTLTGLTSQSSQAIDGVVVSMASSLLETQS